MKRVRAMSAMALAATVAAAPTVVAAPVTVSYTAQQTGLKATETGFVIVDKILQKGKRVGSDRLDCVETVTEAARCAYRVKLPGGTINGSMTLGPISTSGSISVTGGTGTYAGARGTGTWRNLNRSGTRTGITLRLRPPH